MDVNATTHHYHTSIYNTTIQKDWAFILSLSSYCKYGRHSTPTNQTRQQFLWSLFWVCKVKLSV